MFNKNEELQKAYQYCQWLTYSHYENFPVGSWFLPASKRPFISAIYAFARSADDFADEGKYQGKSLELLEAWRDALWISAGDVFRKASSTNGNLKTHPIFLALRDTIQRCSLPLELLDDLLTAFTMDVTKKRYANWEELVTYCRYSANPVGRLVLIVFGYTDPGLYLLSDCICTGLQLANHWQDLSIDLLQKDRFYIPQDLLSKHWLTDQKLKQFAHESMNDDFRSLMEELVRHSRKLFDQGEPLLGRVSSGLRLELKLTLAGGRAILDAIEAADYDVFQKRPVLSGMKKLMLLTRALLP